MINLTKGFVLVDLLVRVKATDSPVNEELSTFSVLVQSKNYF